MCLQIVYLNGCFALSQIEELFFGINFSKVIVFAQFGLGERFDRAKTFYLTFLFFMKSLEGSHRLSSFRNCLCPIEPYDLSSSCWIFK